MRLPACDADRPRCLVVQHVEPEGPYLIAAALAAAGITIDLRRIFAGDPLPADLDGFDALVVMGGPMSVTSDDGFTTRRAEIALLKHALVDARPTLGLCLGAQLLAAAAGADVVAGTAGAEIGWGPVRLLPAALDDPFFSAVGTHTVMHWHGDTFSLPSGAVLLASNANYENQAFRLGPCAWGLQFHVEVDEQAVAAFLASFPDDAERAGCDALATLDAAPAAIAALGSLRDGALGRFAELIWDARVDMIDESVAG